MNEYLTVSTQKNSDDKYNKSDVLSVSGDVGVGLSFGDTVEDVNRQLGTDFVEYPELTTLVIRDTDTDSYIQFTFDENNRISRMEYRFDEAAV